MAYRIKSYIYIYIYIYIWHSSNGLAVYGGLQRSDRTWYRRGPQTSTSWVDPSGVIYDRRDLASCKGVEPRAYGPFQGKVILSNMTIYIILQCCITYVFISLLLGSVIDHPSMPVVKPGLEVHSHESWKRSRIHSELCPRFVPYRDIVICASYR